MNYDDHFITDIRTAKMARGRSINLAMSNRARRSLRAVGLEKQILKCAIPMKGRYLHSTSGKTKSFAYDSRTNQVNILINLLLYIIKSMPI